MHKMNSLLSLICKAGSCAALALSLSAAPVRAEGAGEMRLALGLEESLALLAPQNLIEWKVGDSADYNVSTSGFNIGKMTKSVTKEEGAAIWVHQAINAMGQNQTVDVLLNRADAKILKYVVNGKEESVPDEKIEIISQDFVDVKVPAGTFKAVHIVAKTEKVKKIEMWANPRDTVMEGTLKQYIESGMLPMTIELTGFKRMP